jgi:hypothetical protein
MSDAQESEVAFGECVPVHIGPWDRANNPYLVAFLAAKQKDDTFGGFMKEQQARYLLIPTYSFAVPCEPVLWEIVKGSSHGVLEIGAGTGYWAMLLAFLGADIRAYDDGSGRYMFEGASHGPRKIGKWHPVSRENHIRALAEQPRERTLLLVWPDMSSMAAEALENYKGRTIAYVGEDSGGCNADDRFFELLEKEWVLQVESQIPQWYGVHDRFFLWQRRG